MSHKQVGGPPGESAVDWCLYQLNGAADFEVSEGNHPYTFHANFEVLKEPPFSGDKYRLVKVLAVPLKGENEAFNLLSALNTAACGSILLLADFRFPISKSLKMTAFMDEWKPLGSVHTYMWYCHAAFRLHMQTLRHYIKKISATFPNLNVPP